MKKMILALAVVLLAAPAWATVTITLTDLDDGVIQIGYDATSETELVRAFALDIVATDGNIIAIDDYAKGDDNGGYGIFPGSFRDTITVNTTTGDVDNWDGNPNPYTPVAPAVDTDALGAIPGPAITIEMGSLYTTAAPAKTGVLCTITVEDTVTKVCVTGNAIRGNVVLEDASESALDPAEVCIELGEPDCLPSSHPKYAEWVSVGKPRCWCLKRQCYGDVDGVAEGGPKTGYFYVKFQDLNVLVAAWPVAEPPKGPGIASVTYNGIPGICADSARDQEGGPKTGYFRVKFNDLNKLVASWPIAEPTKGPGLPTDCGGDLNAEDL
ncbi:MAG: hypothetical protein JXN61_12115 [Sedimentisphaerales bacterium]|nr:hypothetical protein [Sedimentisphaerales bacterium]